VWYEPQPDAAAAGGLDGLGRVLFSFFSKSSVGQGRVSRSRRTAGWLLGFGLGCATCALRCVACKGFTCCRRNSTIRADAPAACLAHTDVLTYAIGCTDLSINNKHATRIFAWYVQYSFSLSRIKVCIILFQIIGCFGFS
jgi:hypothetical protein